MDYFRVLIALLVITLYGCSDRSYAPPGISVSQSKQYVPQDTDLALIYNRSCRSCHTVAATGSPLTGDTAAWVPRMDKGMTVLLDNVVNGYGGMPPLGLCMDCDADQFEALIHFMAAPE